MKLWLLRPAKEFDDDRERRVDNPWEPWYDKAFGFVVRAKDEATARRIASEEKGDEGKDAWVDSKYSTCIELTRRGKQEVIIRDFSAA